MTERIDERITQRYAVLSPQERRAAETLLEHLDDLATYRSAELADLAGVSKATMSRLFRSLGFADFDEVRDHLRALRSAGEPRRVDGAPTTADHLAHEQESLRHALESPVLDDVVAAAGRGPAGAGRRLAQQPPGGAAPAPAARPRPRRRTAGAAAGTGDQRGAGRPRRRRRRGRRRLPAPTGGLRRVPGRRPAAPARRSCCSATRPRAGTRPPRRTGSSARSPAPSPSTATPPR